MKMTAAKPNRMGLPSFSMLFASTKLCFAKS